MTGDAFLGGAFFLKQSTYKATSDAIWLAASVPLKSNDSVLDVGIGTGAVSFALLARCPSLCVTGIEKQPTLQQEVMENARLNNREITLIKADITDKIPELKGKQFHHVVTNPPYFEETPLNQKQTTAIAHHEQLSIQKWILFCLKYVAPNGTFSMIHTTEKLPEILSILSEKMGNLKVLPLQSAPDKPAKRCLIQGTLGKKGKFVLLPALLTHQPDGAPTKEAENYLRNGAFLDLKA